MKGSRSNLAKRKNRWTNTAATRSDSSLSGSPRRRLTNRAKIAEPTQKVVKFYNGRGTGEQWIKEGKYAVKWTRLSCRNLKDNQARLQLFALGALSACRHAHAEVWPVARRRLMRIVPPASSNSDMMIRPQ